MAYFSTRVKYVNEAETILKLFQCFISVLFAIACIQTSKFPNVISDVHNVWKIVAILVLLFPAVPPVYRPYGAWP